jgi:hypothetical protein
MTYVLLVLAGRSQSPQSARRPSHHRGNMLVLLIWQGAEGTSDTVSRDGQVAKCEYSVPVNPRYKQLLETATFASLYQNFLILDSLATNTRNIY